MEVQAHARKEAPLFSLSPGGPIDRLQARVRTRKTEHPRPWPRALVAALICWVPLLVITLLDQARQVDVTFLGDIAAHTRFLIVVPLLILAEDPIGGRSRLVATQFLDSGLISDRDAVAYERAMQTGLRLVDSWFAELLILALSALMSWLSVQTVMAEPALFWFERATPAGTTLSTAGWWNFGVANPIFMFLLLRWLWRYVIWWWFLARTARLDLRLTGTHPDRMGGLGFVAYHQSVFCLITMSVACGLSAMAATRILHHLATLKDYQTPIIAITAFSITFGVAPLLVFTRPLLVAKRAGWGRYTRLASEYVWRFEQKWMPGPASEELLGTSDIQSLADIGGSFERMVTMRSFAIDRRLMMSFLFAAAVPMLPLLLTMMSPKEIIKILFQTVM